MMKFLILLAAVFALAFTSSNVLEFHDSDWENNIKNHEIIMVEFYTPWYGNDFIKSNGILMFYAYKIAL